MKHLMCLLSILFFNNFCIHAQDNYDITNKYSIKPSITFGKLHALGLQIQKNIALRKAINVTVDYHPDMGYNIWSSRDDLKYIKLGGGIGVDYKYYLTKNPYFIRYYVSAGLAFGIIRYGEIGFKVDPNLSNLFGTNIYKYMEVYLHESYFGNKNRIGLERLFGATNNAVLDLSIGCHFLFDNHFNVTDRNLTVRGIESRENSQYRYFNEFDVRLSFGFVF